MYIYIYIFICLELVVGIFPNLGMVNWIRDNQGYLVKPKSPTPNPIQMAKEGSNHKEN